MKKEEFLQKVKEEHLEKYLQENLEEKPLCCPKELYGLYEKKEKWFIYHTDDYGRIYSFDSAKTKEGAYDILYKKLVKLENFYCLPFGNPNLLPPEIAKNIG